MGCDRAAWISRECQIWILPNRNCLLQGRAGTATCSTRTSAYIVFAQQGGEAADRHEPAVGRVAQKRLLGLVVSACLSLREPQLAQAPNQHGYHCAFSTVACVTCLRAFAPLTPRTMSVPQTFPTAVVCSTRHPCPAGSLPAASTPPSLQSHSLGMEQSCCGATTLAELSVLLRIRLTW